MRVLFSGTLLLLTTTVFASQDYEVTVTTVNVWVRAVDKSGAPVEKLTQEDFEVYEDNQRMVVSCFDEISQNVDVVSAEQPATKKRFVLYLDLYNVTTPEWSLIQPKIIEFLQQISKHNYDVMIAAMIPQGRLGVIAPFTNDAARLGPVIEKATANAGRDAEIRNNEARIVDLLEELRSEGDNPADSLDDLTQISPRRDLNTRILKTVYGHAHQFAEEERYRTEFSVKALESFSAYLAKAAKNDHIVLLYVSGGFNSDPGRRYYDLIERVAENRGLNRDSFVLSVRAGDKKRSSQFNMEKLVQNSIGKLNRLNITLYGVNTRGLGLVSENISAKGDMASNEAQLLPAFLDSLRFMAEETGGISFQNSQNFKVGFDGILQDLGHQYQLCYSPPEHKAKGQYHKIKVVMKKPGVQTRYRNGYVD
ncbi:VWA domain-containing protein [bacterium]|nr:VWA domain-containing protein [bacterium]